MALQIWDEMNRTMLLTFTRDFLQKYTLRCKRTKQILRSFRFKLTLVWKYGMDENVNMEWNMVQWKIFSME